MTPATKVAFIVSVLALFIGACSGSAFPPASPASPLEPSATLAPTRLPQFTPSPAPTAPVASPTSTLAPGPELACKLNWQSPHHGIKLEPRSDFTAQWNVTNTGTVAWDPGIVDFAYANGTRMFLQSPIPLESRVAPGQTVTLAVEMKALRNTSSYITNFALRRGDTLFCNVGIKIFVQLEAPEPQH